MLPRHSLVWFSYLGWRAALSQVKSEASSSVEEWVRAGFPATVCRTEPDMSEDLLCAGIALPPDPIGLKRRIPLQIPSKQVVRTAAPLRLEDIIPVMPMTWQSALQQLCSASKREQITFHAYGSAALQKITGRRYVTETSDIDLLFYPRTGSELQTGLQILVHYARMLPLDGEIIFPDGSAVAWKEWIAALTASKGLRVLTKDARGIHLAKTEELMHSLEVERCISH